MQTFCKSTEHNWRVLMALVRDSISLFSRPVYLNSQKSSYAWAWTAFFSPLPSGSLCFPFLIKPLTVCKKKKKEKKVPMPIKFYTEVYLNSNVVSEEVDYFEYFSNNLTNCNYTI
jgi:hypothetical protein